MDDLRDRTQMFAVNIIRFVEKLPKTTTAEILGRQLLRAGTSVGANYRAACRAKSLADFISKMKTVEEETDETMYWMELMIKTHIAKDESVCSLMNEANELVRIFVSSIKTAKENLQAKKLKQPV